jgi:SPP1 gp7 family putative phage head morphogenesis protein
MLSRRLRKVKAEKLKAPKSAENRYVSDLRNISKQVHTYVLGRLKLRQDAVTDHSGNLDEIGVIAIAAMGDGVGAAFDRMSKSVNEKSKGALNGITQNDTRLGSAIAAARNKNIELMRNAGSVYIDQVRSILEDPQWVGKTSDDLAEEIVKRGDVSQSRAELIARDQTLKLNSNITKIRCGNAGITKYVWNTSHDERVRDDHRVLDGETFDFATGAPSLDGLNPGEDFQCRCVALPVFTSEDGEG